MNNFPGTKTLDAYGNPIGGCHMGFSHYAYDAIWGVGKMLDQWLSENVYHMTVVDFFR